MHGRGHAWQGGNEWQWERGVTWQGGVSGRGCGTHVPWQIPQDIVNEQVECILLQCILVPKYIL